MQTEFLWTEKYRPQVIEDVILPAPLKKIFKDYSSAGEFPNLILEGPPGTGKTTIAMAMCRELDHEVYFVNASLHGNIDTLRVNITNFATALSLTGQKKCVILDEADRLTRPTQDSLRSFMEQHSNNCRFILTCNHANQIIEPLHSRCKVISFRVKASDKQVMIAGAAKMVVKVLKAENITYDTGAVVEFVKKFWPDNRRILNELQGASASGSITTEILAHLAGLNINELVVNLKKKDFKPVQKWVVDNLDNDVALLFRSIYDGMYEYVADSSIPHLVVLIGEYSYKMAFAMDPEITMMAFMVEVMANIDFK